MLGAIMAINIQIRLHYFKIFRKDDTVKVYLFRLSVVYFMNNSLHLTMITSNNHQYRDNKKKFMPPYIIKTNMSINLLQLWLHQSKIPSMMITITIFLSLCILIIIRFYQMSEINII